MVARDELTDHEVQHIFQALADATRRDVVTRVLRQEQSVSALAGHYRMSFAAVQKHVAVPERALLVTKEKRGREQVVHGNVGTVRRAAGLLEEYEELWRGRARRIEGGRCRYYMTGPDGEKARGWWTVTAVDPPHRLEFDDGFADADGEPDPALGATHSVVTRRHTHDARGRLQSAEQLEQTAAMGMEEGMRQAMGQIDDLLAGAVFR